MSKNFPATGNPPALQAQIDAKYNPSPRMKALINRTQAELDEIERQAVAPKRASKYNAKRTPYRSVQGFERVYDSAAEAKYAAELDMRIKGKMVSYWLPQVPIPLVGGVKYVADFLVFYKDGTHKFWDVKGRDTQASINKRKQVAASFPIAVEVVGKSR